MMLKINWIKQETILIKKTKYIDELKEIQELNESELNEKNKNINMLKNNIKDLENESR